MESILDTSGHQQNQATLRSTTDPHHYTPRTKTTSTSTQLTDEAGLHAKLELSEWIRSTLRQTFLQALPQAWEVEQPGNRIVFSAETLTQCLDSVRRVSQKWQEKLREADHDETATWVEDVYSRGKNTLWSDQMTTGERNNSERKKNNDNIHCQDEDGVPKSDLPLGKNENFESRNNQQQQQEKESNEESQNVASISTDRSLQLHRDCQQQRQEVPYSVLRRLGKRTSLDQPYLTNQEALQALKQMGESGRNSFWPLDWALVDQACADIPTRFKSEGNVAKLSYQVVPKSLFSSNKKQDGQQQKEDTSDKNTSPSSSRNPKAVEKSAEFSMHDEGKAPGSPVSKVLSSLLERKRKRSGKSESTATTNSASSRQKQTESANIVSRPPSEISSSRHNVNEELSKQEKEQLESLLHNDEDMKGDHSEGFSILTIFGPLDKVGHIHKRLQNDDLTNETNPTDKEQRRRFRARIQERINPRRIVKNKDIQNFPSRVLRTEDRNDDSKKYLELDMGWSLMEYRSSTNKKRRYCAFSGLEILLEDKDPPGPKNG